MTSQWSDRSNLQRGGGSDEFQKLAFRHVRIRRRHVHCGDITDLGYVAQLDVFASVWRRTMPAGIPLVAAFGNRDMSDTSKMPEERREADRSRLILADPAAAMKMVCGWSGEFGVRALEVK